MEVYQYHRYKSFNFIAFQSLYYLIIQTISILFHIISSSLFLYNVLSMFYAFMLQNKKIGSLIHLQQILKINYYLYISMQNIPKEFQ